MKLLLESKGEYKDDFIIPQELLQKAEQVACCPLALLLVPYAFAKHLRMAIPRLEMQIDLQHRYDNGGHQMLLHIGHSDH